MTQKELEKMFDDLFLELGVSLKDGRKNLTHYYMRLVNQHVAEVIGENEIEPTGKDGWKYMPEERAKNKLRAEQRKHAPNLQTICYIHKDPDCKQCEGMTILKNSKT